MIYACLSKIQIDIYFSYGKLKKKITNFDSPKSPFAKGDLRNSPLAKRARGIEIIYFLEKG